MNRGHTLIELATALALFGAFLAIASPSFVRYRDLSAVLATRESIAGAVATGRATALGAGGSEVVVLTSGDAFVVAAGDTTRIVRAEDADGVTVDVGGGAEVVLPYDEMGLGRVASATLRFRRGTAERSLVVSSFGRVSRR